MKNKISIIIIAIMAIVICGLAILLVKKDSSNQEKTDLTTEEQFAIDYLLNFSELLQPHSIKLYKIWSYEKVNGEGKTEWYFAYSFSANNLMGNQIEYTFGNTEGITEETRNKKVISIQNMTNLPAKEKGTVLDTEKIQKAFEEQL